MTIFELIKGFFSITWSVLSFLFKRLFWKNANIVYINDNKKKTNKRDLTKEFDIEHHKFISIYTDGRNASLKKIHLALMKINQKTIIRNMANQPNLYYSGFASVPFAVYDGYIISDNFVVQLCDKTKNDNEEYKVEFKKKRPKENNYSITSTGAINLVVSSSYPIRHELITNGLPIYDSDISLINDKITNDYLNDVYFKIFDFLDQAGKNGIKRVNLYLSSRQAVSFVIGSAIQVRHPEVVVYEYDGTKYTWGLSMKTRRILK